MRRLTYWYSQCLDDADAYSIRARTKRECLAERDKIVGLPGWPAKLATPEGRAREYGPVIKVSVAYRDAFDLMEQCSNEDHHYWENYGETP